LPSDELLLELLLQAANSKKLMPTSRIMVNFLNVFTPKITLQIIISSLNAQSLKGENSNGSIAGDVIPRLHGSAR
jgi:hypothetical protein